MTVDLGDGRRGVSPHRYRAMRDFVQSMDDTVPGRFEITGDGIVHDMTGGVGRHELTAACVRRRLEKVMPEEIVTHTGKPDVEDQAAGILRRGGRHHRRLDHLHGEPAPLYDSRRTAWLRRCPCELLPARPHRSWS